MDSTLEKMLQMTSYKAIENILNGATLAPFQSIDLLTALYVRKALIRYDTGMGKTFIASGIMKALYSTNNKVKTVMFIKNHQLIQTPAEIERLTGLKVITTDATSDSINSFIFNRKFVNYDVLVLTHECLNNSKLMSTLFMEKQLLGCVIVDEIHELCNYHNSNNAMMLKSMVKNIPYVYGLTATPLVSSIDNLLKMLRIIDYNLVESLYGSKKALLDFAKQNSYVVDIMKSSEGITDSDISQFYPGRVISRSRQSVGIVSNYIAKAHIVKPTIRQLNAMGSDMFRITRGPGSLPQASKVLEIINQQKPGKGLIYVWRHEVREFLTEVLRNSGIRFACINGNTSIKDRKIIQDNFEKGEYDVVITSVTSSLNFDCEYVIFYEFTLDYDQMTGRAERGLNAKTLYVHYIFTENTGEADFFKQYIYDRAYLTTSLLGVNTKGVLDIYEQIKHLITPELLG